MTSRRIGLLVAAALAVTLGMVGVFWLVDRFASDNASLRLRPDDAALTAQGRQIYQAHCASCHGANLEGQPRWRERGADGSLPAPPHDASGHTWHHPDAVLFDITKRGVAKVAGMPGYVTAMPVYDGVLSDTEIIAVLSWIKAQWPASVREKHDQINAQAHATARP